MRRHARAHGGFARRAPRGGASPGRTLVPAERVTRVLPTCFTENMEGALMSYHSFLRKTSWAFFLPPFLPLDMRLFLPTAILLGWGGRAAVKGLAGRPDAREIIRVFEPRRAGGNESLKNSDTQATSRKKTIQHVLKTTLNTLAICFAGACLPSTASRNARTQTQPRSVLKPNCGAFSHDRGCGARHFHQAHLSRRRRQDGARRGRAGAAPCGCRPRKSAVGAAQPSSPAPHQTARR